MYVVAKYMYHALARVGSFINIEDRGDARLITKCFIVTTLHHQVLSCIEGR